MTSQRPLPAMLLRARTVVPNPTSQIDDGAVFVRGDRVERVGRFAELDSGRLPVFDLGEAALLPGLVNAHAHLDLTATRGRFRPTRDFAGWIRGFRSLREELHEGAVAAVEEGARELLDGGCTLVADMVNDFAGTAGLHRAGIRAVAYHEVIEFGGVAPKPLEAAVETVARSPREGVVLPGLAPHTPYTCSERILRECTEAGRKLGMPLALHVAETRQEVEFLLRGEGDLADLFRSGYGSEWRPPGKRPAVHLRDLGLLDEPRLLAHGNWLDREEMEMLRERRAVVVHCPGSHAFFGHERHPVADLREVGVRVALGTDCLACHPDTVQSMPAEIRRLAAREPSIPPEELLAMATANGAAGLGLAGVLAPGSFADAAAFFVPGGWKGPESLLDPDLTCMATFVGGKRRGGSMSNLDLTE